MVLNTSDPRPKIPRPAAPKSQRLPLAQRVAPYVFVAPFVITFSLFGAWPLVKSLVLAFYITNGPKSQVFVGWANFRYLLADPDFHKAVWNTAVLAFWSVFLQLPLALGLAILLSRPWLRGREAFRLIFFSPNLLGQVFVGVLFSVLYIPQYGLLNRALHALTSLPVIRTFGQIPLDTKWLSNPALVMPAIVLTSLWMYVGFNMIYFLAALQAVDRDLYEAAIVDGAGPWHQFLAVTLPSIKPVAIFVLVTATIGSFQLFELPYLLLNNTAGPNNAGLTVVMYLYDRGFQIGDLGYASAVGWTLAAAVLLISLAQMKITGAFRGTGE